MAGPLRAGCNSAGDRKGVGRPYAAVVYSSVSFAFFSQSLPVHLNSRG